MPRDPSGLYSRPFGTTAISGAIITDEIFNDSMDDIAGALSDSPRRTELSDLSGALISAGTASAYTLTPATPVTALTNGLSVAFRPNVTNTAPAVTLTGTLTLGSAVVTDVVVPAGVLAGPVVTSSTTGIPSNTTLSSKTATTLVLSTPYLGVTTPGASITIASTTPTLKLGTMDAKAIVALNGSAVKAGELVAGWVVQVRYDATLDAFVLGQSGSRVRATNDDPLPGALSDKLTMADGSAVVIQTGPGGTKQIVIPAASLQAGDLFQSGRAIFTGALLCDGSSYLQSAYPALYSVIGQAFATFNTTSVAALTTVAVKQRHYSSIFSKWYAFSDMFTASGSVTTISFAYSSDRTTWSGTATISPGYTDPAMSGVVEGNGILAFVIHAVSGATDCKPATSSNGTTISVGSAISGFVGWNMAFGNGKFVMTALGAVLGIYNSADAVAWTSRTLSATTFTDATVAFGNGVHVVVTKEGRVFRSSNGGDTWAEVSTPGIEVTPSGTRTLRFGNGQFVLGGLTSRIYTTPDGVMWTRRNMTAFPKINIGSLWVVETVDGQITTVNFTSYLTQIAKTDRGDNSGANGWGATDGTYLGIIANTTTNYAFLSFTNNPATDFRVPTLSATPVASYIRSA
jgi:hypothetical protein